MTTGFDTVKEILSSQENAVVFTRANKYGVMSLSGETIIEPEYDEIKGTNKEYILLKMVKITE